MRVYRLRAAVAFCLGALFCWSYGDSIWLRKALLSTQISPHIMRGGAGIFLVLSWVACALVAGRWYCSVMCPLGTLQEAAWLLPGPKKRGHYRVPALRYALPALVGVTFAAGFPALFYILDPVSNFGRGAQTAGLILSSSAPAMGGVSLLAGLFALIMVVSYVRGRAFCQICPVGVALGACSQAAPFGIRVGKTSCVSCMKCERACPCGCIDATERSADFSRCVVCLRCVAACPTGTIRYGREEAHAGRRAFIRSSVALSLASAAAYFGAPFLRYGAKFAAEAAILPPGAVSGAHFAARCSACQSCVAACPVGIVRSKNGTRPHLDYSRSYCQFNCRDCIASCPTGALADIPLEEKQRTRVGMSVLHYRRCVTNHGLPCGACAEVCPTRALHMSDGDVPRPIFEAAYCIGCGGCLYVCPVGAFAILPADPQETTRGIRPSEEATPQIQQTDDFPF